MQNKANFSNVFSDFIISIGFQGAAITSAFAFKKPLIFYTENNIYFERSNFYIQEKDNQKIISLIKELTYSHDLLSNALSNKVLYEKFYSKITERSQKLLMAFELTENLKNTKEIIENLIK